MATTGIDHIYLETHNWGAAVAYWQAMGYTLEFSTEHNSGRLDPPDGGPYLFLAEVAESKALDLTIYLGVAAGDEFHPDVEVTSDYAPTHWGTRVMSTKDPDGRTIYLEQPVG